MLIADIELPQYTQAMLLIATVITDPPASLTPNEVELIGMVQEFGWRSMSVFAGDDGEPAFSYTTGFWITVDQPELIVFDFPPDLSHDVFGQMMRRAKAGDRFPLRQPVEGILSNEPVFLFPVTQEASALYMLSSDWFYRHVEFPAIQLVWADGSGRFPWERDFDASLSTLQPDLSPLGWAEELNTAANGS